MLHVGAPWMVEVHYHHPRLLLVLLEMFLHQILPRKVPHSHYLVAVVGSDVGYDLKEWSSTVGGLPLVVGHESAWHKDSHSTNVSSLIDFVVQVLLLLWLIGNAVVVEMFV